MFLFQIFHFKIFGRVTINDGDFMDILGSTYELEIVYGLFLKSTTGTCSCVL